MKLSRKSIVLVVIAAVLAAMNLLARGTQAGPVAGDLPSLADVKLDEVTKFTITTPVEKMTIERGSKDDPWMITTPIQYPADEETLEAILKLLTGGVRMDTLVDEGNLEDYGVDHQKGLLAEVWTTGEVPPIGVMVGKTAGNNASFVRLPGAQKVYRADIGARSRYERPAAEWRDKVALDVKREDIATMVIERGEETLRFARKGEDFAMEGPPFPLDTDGIELIARSLARVRAGQIHHGTFEGGFESPAAVATLTMKDGKSHRIVLGSREDAKAAFLRVDDQDVVFRVSAQVRPRLLQPLSDLRDRLLLSYAKAEAESLTWSEGGITVAIAQDEAGKWTVTQPANMDADQRQVTFVNAALAQLRAPKFAPDETFAPSGTKLTVKLRGGTVLLLEFGQVTEGNVRVRASGRPGIFLLPVESLGEIRRAFGRG